MRRTETPATRPFSRLKTGLLLVMVAASAPTAAHDGAGYHVDPVDYEFRASHPFRVFVDLERGQTRKAYRQDANDHYIRDRLRYVLPSNIVIVSRRRDADMTVQARLTDYNLSFHVTDIARRNKKYKKRYRYTPGQCGHHKRAFYTRVTEKGVAVADYQLTYRIRGEGAYADALRVHAAESYRYGENLQALTNCGVVPSANYPNSTVARLFTQAGGHYRDTLAQEIRTEGLRNLAQLLAGKIRARADQFYVSLAARHDSFGPSRGSAVYDYDDVEPRRRPAYGRWQDD